jgi:hypothetical protein
VAGAAACQHLLPGAHHDPRVCPRARKTAPERLRPKDCARKTAPVVARRAARAEAAAKTAFLRLWPKAGGKRRPGTTPGTTAVTETLRALGFGPGKLPGPHVIRSAPRPRPRRFVLGLWAAVGQGARFVSLRDETH